MEKVSPIEDIGKQLRPLFKNTSELYLVGVFNVGQYGDLVTQILPHSVSLFNVYVTSSLEIPSNIPKSRSMDLLILVHNSLGSAVVKWTLDISPTN